MVEFAEDYEKLAGVFGALAHPLRLSLIANTLEGKLCVRDLGEMLDRSQPNISQHLAVLRERGLVTAERKGKRVCYRLTDECLTQVIRLAAKCCD
ncbi:MAG: ArsR/SmtB family transcription factor [Armatimonadota bacterium]